MTKHSKQTEPGAGVPAAPGPAGEFADWLRATRRARSLRVLGSDVPCGSCNACCRSAYFIHVRPDDTRSLQRIPRQLLFPAPGAPPGHMLMGFNEHGQCPMLIDQRCSIYDDRPQTCRDYDCRIFAATGIDPGRDGGRADIAARVQQWSFSYRDDASRAAHTAVQAAGTFLHDQRASFPEGALPTNPVQLAVLALEIHELFVREGKASTLTSPAEIARAVLAELDARRPPPPPPLSSLPTTRRPRPGARRRRHP